MTQQHADEQAPAATASDIPFEEALVRDGLGVAVQLLDRPERRDVLSLIPEVLGVEVEYNETDWNIDHYSMYLEVAAEALELWDAKRLDTFNEVFSDIVRRKWPETHVRVFVREQLPPPATNWRAEAKARIVGDVQVSNAGRKIPRAEATFEADGLRFTNAGELQVYEALRKLQDQSIERDPHATFSIAPLPGVHVGNGHTWEPDFVITYRGRAGALEVDGPNHNRRYANDASRDQLFENAGFLRVERIPVEVLRDPSELEQQLVRFLRLLGKTSLNP